MLTAQRLTAYTVSVYYSDVRRFLSWIDATPLSALGPNMISDLLGEHLSRRGRQRMICALSDFFAFAFSAGAMDRDPLRILKYRRSGLAVHAQLDFLDLLKEHGIREVDARQLIWADFLQPLLQRHENSIRLHQKPVRLSREAWNRFEVEFRVLVRHKPLEEVLAARIVA